MFLRKNNFISLGLFIGLFWASGFSAEAATVTVNCSGTSSSPTAVAEADLAADDVTFSDVGGDGWCVLDESISAASILIETGVTLTHVAEDSDGVNISTSGDFTIENGAYINADEKGCAAPDIDSNTNGFGPNSSNVCTISTAGYGGSPGAGAGAHGGAGGNGVGVTASNGGSTYGSVTAPILFGSSSGRSFFAAGGKGGGRIRLDVTGTFTHNGGLSVSGGDGKGFSTNIATGGGAGGSIYVTAGTVAGSTGTFTSNGGNGFDNGTADGGGGGGGRIALSFASSTFSFDSSDFSATGGLGPDSAVAGSKGTVYVKNTTANSVNIFEGFSYDDTDYNVTSWIIDSSATNQYCVTGTTTPSITAATLTFGGTLDCDASISSFNFSASSSFSISSGTTITIDDLGADVDFTIPDGADQTWTNVTFNGGAEGNFTISDAIDINLVNTNINANAQWTNLTGLSIDSNSSINANDKGCQAPDVDADSNGFGPNGSNVCTISTAGYGQNSFLNSSGGGHGGAGGTGAQGKPAGVSYGSSTAPVLFGSSSGRSVYAAGGGGGGFVRLDVSGTFTHNGSVSADGGAGYGFNLNIATGGGSGGSIYVTVGTLAGSTGSFSAAGGDGYDNSDVNADGGGGGGGRISLTGIDISSFGSSLEAATVVAGGAGPGNAGDGAVGSLYKLLYSVPSQPSVSSPTKYFGNHSVNLTLSSSSYSSNGASHSSSDWKITTDSVGSNIVWSKNDDTVNKTSITVNSSNGTFSGVLAGASALQANTTYYAFVRHTNSVGDSSWSPTGHAFKTTVLVSVGSNTWDFLDAGNYTYQDSTIGVASSLASLDDLGGGIYTSAGIDGNTRYKIVTVTNNESSELTNFQVQLNVTYDADMQADFDDLRFTNSNGSSQLDYWIQSYTASTSAVVWVEVPSIPSSSSATIRMYYGNSSLNTTSNEDNTFLAADDFSGVTIDGEWTEVTAGGASAGTLSGGSWTKTCDGECDWWNANDLDAGIYMQDPGPSVSWEAVTYLSSSNVNANRQVGIMLYQGARDGYMWGPQAGTSNTVGVLTGGSPTCTLGGGSVPSYLKVIKATSNGLGVNNTYTFWRSTDGSTWSQCATLTPSDVMNNLGLFVKDWTSGASNASFDFFYVKKYTPNAPSVSFGSEQTVDLSTLQIVPNTGVGYTELTTFSETLGGGNAGSIRYQISNNGTDWYYHNGTTWTTASNDALHYNPATQVNGYLPFFPSQVGTGTFYFKAFLISNGAQVVELDRVTLGYDAGAPTGLASLAFASGTATTATLTWSAASEPAFDHYEIWFGANQSDVQNRTGTATEWDNSDDANLATVSTATTTVSGLTAGLTYYAKIWAVDGFGAEATIADISFTTNQAPSFTFTSASQNASAKTVNIVGTVDDPDDDDTVSLDVEYSVDGGSNWAQATITSVSATTGAPGINNGLDNYQVGIAGSYIATSSGANTLTLVWDAVTDTNGVDISNAKIRITPNDQVASGTLVASSEFSLDLLGPSGLTALGGGIATNQASLTWTKPTDANFSHYVIYYAGTEAEVNAKQGTSVTQSDNSTLGSIGTTGITIVGAMSQRYIKLYAYDTFGNESTVAALYTGTPTVTIGSGGGGSGGGGGSSSTGGGSSSSSSSSSSSTNTDTSSSSDLDIELPDHWSSGYVKHLLEDEHIVQYAIISPSFADIINEIVTRPDEGITRGKMLEFLFAYVDYEEENYEFNARELRFSDVDEDHPLVAYIQFAAEAGLINGYPDGTFRPESVVNRAEALKMLTTFFEIEGDWALRRDILLTAYGLVEAPFVDVDLEAWYSPYVVHAYTNGVVRGYGDGRFGPADLVTYAQLLKITTLYSDLEGAIELASELEN